MKTGKRIIALCLVCIMVMMCFTACKGGSGNGKTVLKEGQTEISISYWNLGLGEEWLKETIEAFEEKYPEYKVTYKASAAYDSISSALGMEDIDKTDLYLNHIGSEILGKMVALDEVLEATADGDKTPLKDKINSEFLKSSTSPDGHVYSLTFGGGVMSLVYNKDLFDKASVTQFPRTTDELVVVCDQLYSKKITPFCHFTGGGYYEHVAAYYQAQYDGIEYYRNNFYACTDENGTSPSKDVLMKQDGRYQALKAFEQFVTPEYTLTGSNTKSHTEIQTEFAVGKTAMMFNGSWLTNELETTGGIESIAMMRMPVLSSVIDNLSTVSNDYVLRDLITAIDDVTDGKKQLSDFASGDNYVVNGSTISADDWNKVMEMRNMVLENFYGSASYIPTYSDNIEGAKKFIQFMNSDEGLKIYHKVNAMPKPIQLSTGEDFDYSGLNDFETSQFEMMSTATAMVDCDNASSHKIFTEGGAKPFAGISYISSMCTNNVESRRTAEQLWKSVTKRIDEKFDTSWLPNIQ